MGHPCVIVVATLTRMRFNFVHLIVVGASNLCRVAEDMRTEVLMPLFFQVLFGSTFAGVDGAVFML